jgi:hypothetical protein
LVKICDSSFPSNASSLRRRRRWRKENKGIEIKN